MNDEMTRKHFLKLGVGAATVALLPGCPADDDTDTGAGSTSTGDSNTSPTTTNSTTSPTTTTASTTDATTTDTTTDATTTSPTTDTEGTETSSGSTDPDSGSSTDATESSSSGNEESSSTGVAADCDHDPDVAIGGNHMGAEHVMVVTLEEVMTGSMVVYDITGDSVHSHHVTLSAGDMATLAGGGMVMVVSTPANRMMGGHTHTVTITCM